jgi:hypothetical protein
MKYIAEESDIKETVFEFIKFCEFIETKKPHATPKGDLSVKACYEINQILRYPEKNVKSTDRIHKYTSVSLWFAIARETGLIAYNEEKGGKTVFNTTEKYIDLKKMNVFSQYLFLFQTWFCFVDPEVQYGDRGFSAVLGSTVDMAFARLAKHDCQKWIVYDENKSKIYNNGDPVQIMMSHDYKTAHNLMDFGLVVFEESGLTLEYYNLPIIGKLKPTQFGSCIMKACENRKYIWFNVYASTRPSLFILEIKNSEDNDEKFEKTMETIETGAETFLTPFLDYFPQGSIDITAVNKITFEREDRDNDERIFEFTVSLSKKCYRIICCLPSHTFEDLHLAIQEAFEFDDDHLYSFYLDGKRYSDYSVNSPYSDNPPYTDEVRLGDTRLINKQRILYLFDYGDCWEFDILVDVKTGTDISFEKPEIIKTAGESPEQYYYD